MVRVAHEAPLYIFDQVQQVTDYDYCLVHLLEENQNYLDKFIEAVNKWRYVILDNSVFELGEAFDSNRYLYWINKLQPAEYIIPDVLEDAQATVKRLGEWIVMYQPQIKGYPKSIGVVQGKSYEEIVWCYKQISPMVDKVAISFDYSFMCNNDSYTPSTRCEVFMRGRQKLIKQLLDDSVINTEKPHHLLGCYLPQEFLAYKDYRWIDTIDTSNPVVHGINNIYYENYGLKDKVKTKLVDYINDSLTPEQIHCIMHNIQKFKEFI